MDKVLNVQHLSVLDLIDSAEVNKRASILPPSDDEFDNVMVADPQIAACEAVIMSKHVKRMLKFRKSFLKRLKTEMEDNRSAWERFVIVKAAAHEGMSMYSRITPGATLLPDRNYNSTPPCRKDESNVYALRKNQTCSIKYVETANDHLILRPHNPAYPIEVIMLEDGQKPGDCIVGRVCYVGTDT